MVAGVTLVTLLVSPLAGGSTAFAQPAPATSPDGDTTTHVPEFTVTPSAPDEADAATEEVAAPTHFPATAGANAAAGELRAVYSARVPPAAKPAIESALDRWAAAVQITVPVEVAIDWLPTDSESLVGAARPTVAVADFGNAPRPGIFYPVALANQLAGIDHLPAESDIEVILADRSDWDYATADPVTPGRISLSTVVLHEVLHGLGFATAFDVDAAGVGQSLAPGGAAAIFDHFVTDRNGTPIIEIPNGSAALGNALTGGLFWHGPRGMAADGGSPPVLFSPSPFQPESSIAHLDELTYPAGHRDAISTPFILDDEAIDAVGIIAPAMLADMGWALETDPAPEPTPPVSVPDPVTTVPPLPTPQVDPTPVTVPVPEPEAPAPELALAPPVPAEPAVPTTGKLPETGFPTFLAGVLGALAVAGGAALVERSRWSRPVSTVGARAPASGAGGSGRYRLPA